MFEKLNYLDFNEAIKKSFELSNTTLNSEIIPIAFSLNKVASKDILCVKNLPAFDNSAMDGFAFKVSDAGKTLKIKRAIFAGDKDKSSDELLNENECYKIMTGAKVPKDADTIIAIENCLNVTQDSATIPDDIKKGSNLRLEAEELKVSDVLIKKGEKINSSHIALLASQGIVMVEVYKQISIAVLSTGNELKEPWQTASNEEIYNCNSFAIIAQLNEKGFNATYCGVIPDDLEKSTNFINSLKKYDVIITSGGISMGDADFVADAFLKNGLEVAFHGVNIKPGRPMMMGNMDNSLVICMPGNPLTAMVNINLFVIPMLKKLQGENAFYHGYIKAINQSSFKTKIGRVNIVLGRVQNGNFYVTDNNNYGSGMITAFYKSNSILVTNASTSNIQSNQDVKIIDLNGIYFEEITDILN
ncbi:molybdopterin molybdenumtransferase MoeA [Aliarcobacter cryaerophilus ATCC 43158]|uniref:Molybdopterin molybdenumtransferase n=1 Tax=Aliarcobacter cryaerophilus ATCC 43158 TaxID=1032070 RepID=A0AAD0XAE9_9BACT|nr:molybdopterin molybdotransferase MoeA [Aliarcobacter cryaerophilus]AYJ80317.1 molybdopterin molybdenumtransferase [Aliarcobacter cryaerophilus ATCC 43158]PRM98731.1 molybdopterin molybdenumtransferase MoeA [Aliarcobacter cryaerophilus]QCZ24532.1 molybdopterin molybdenumtransferase MoeA [Aliarcobacter cryaerophilus ATCC 43158]